MTGRTGGEVPDSFGFGNATTNGLRFEFSHVYVDIDFLGTNREKKLLPKKAPSPCCSASDRSVFRDGVTDRIPGAKRKLTNKIRFII